MCSHLIPWEEDIVSRVLSSKHFRTQEDVGMVIFVRSALTLSPMHSVDRLSPSQVTL